MIVDILIFTIVDMDNVDLDIDMYTVLPRYFSEQIFCNNSKL